MGLILAATFIGAIGTFVKAYYIGLVLPKVVTEEEVEEAVAHLLRKQQRSMMQLVIRSATSSSKEIAPKVANAISHTINQLFRIQTSITQICRILLRIPTLEAVVVHLPLTSLISRVLIQAHMLERVRIINMQINIGSKS